MNVRADTPVETSEVDLSRRGILGADGPKLPQEYIEGRPAERKTRRWRIFFPTNSFGEHFHIGEWNVVLKYLPLPHPLDLACPLWGVRIVVREKEFVEGKKGFGEPRKLRAIGCWGNELKHETLNS